MVFCYVENKTLRQIIPYMLAESNLECTCFSTGKELAKAIKEAEPKLVIVDATSEYESGEAVLSYVRELCRPKGVPIVIIALEITRLSEFCEGKEVLLLKPINLSKLTDAVNLAFAKAGPGEKRLIKCGKISIDMENKSAKVSEHKIELTGKEFDLLHILTANPERVYTRQQLFACLWESSYMGKSRTVDVHIGKLRAKLGEAGEYIKTVRDKGYCLSKGE